MQRRRCRVCACWSPLFRSRDKGIVASGCFGVACDFELVFLIFFLHVVEGGFYRGFWEKHGDWCGVFVV